MQVACEVRQQAVKKQINGFGEMAESGLRRTTGNRVYGEPYQGFESLSLRQTENAFNQSVFCLPFFKRDSNGHAMNNSPVDC